MGPRRSNVLRRWMHDYLALHGENEDDAARDLYGVLGCGEEVRQPRPAAEPRRSRISGQRYVAFGSSYGDEMGVLISISESPWWISIREKAMSFGTPEANAHNVPVEHYFAHSHHDSVRASWQKFRGPDNHAGQVVPAGFS